MSLVNRLLVIACLVPLPALLAQPGKKGKEPPGEEVQLEKAIEQALRPRKTERDQLLKSLVKLTDGEQLDRPDAGDAEFAAWFARLADGQPAWRRDDRAKKPLREIHDRITQRMRLAGDEVRRDEFIRYARHYLSPKDSPAWDDKPPKDPLEEPRKIFRKLDRDRDGALAADELPDGLRADLRRWDEDRDGRINEKEYLRRFGSRLREVARDRGVVLPGEEPPPRTEARPTVSRATRLPPGLPDWFSALDTDRDGQVGLYEWKRAGRTLADFRMYDANADGFITADECLRVVRMARASESGK
jgi:hypothetical protein